MRRVLGLLLLVALCVPAFAEILEGRILQGEVWKDTEGHSINAHGGGVMYHDGVYYWYGEYKKGVSDLPKDSKWYSVSGVSCYSSKNLRDWKFEGVVLSRLKDDKTHDLYENNVLERPKVVYNTKTKKFVMWVHVDSPDYAKACAGVAVCDTPTGEFTYLGSFRPNGQMSRDQTLFVDDDGKAYQVCSSENNATLYINELTDDYLKPTGRFTRNFENKSREAPALFKKDGKYYMITSACTGWAPNKADLAVADSIMGHWRMTGNPCTGKDADITFYGQSAYVLEVDKDGTKSFIAMFDRWNPKKLRDSRYLWLPIKFDGKGDVTIPWQDRF